MSYELEGWAREHWALGPDEALDLWRDKWAAEVRKVWRDIGMDAGGLNLYGSDFRAEVAYSLMGELMSGLSMALPGWALVLTHLEQDESEYMREVWEGGIRARDFRPVETWPGWDEWREAKPKPSMRGAVALALRADWDAAGRELSQVSAAEWLEWLDTVEARHGLVALHGLLAAAEHSSVKGGMIDGRPCALTMVRARLGRVRLRDLAESLY